MTIIEQIKAEIERRITDNTFGAKLELIDILAWLDTLESENPMQEGLEEEIATYLKDWEDDEEIGLHLSTDNGCVTIELDDIRDLARHFAQWQKEQMMSNAVEGTVYGNGVYTWVAGDIPSQFKYGDKVRIIIVKE